MTWARVDDGWWCHPKVVGLNASARGLWISALSWSCARRADHVPASMLVLLMPGEDASQACADLEAAGLWTPDEAGDGWRVHDWHEFQQATVSEKRADAGRKGGQARGGTKTEASKPKQPASKRQAPAKQEAKQDSRPDPTRTQPDPSLVDAAAPTGRAPDLLFDALLDACGWQLPTLTADARGRVNRARAQLAVLDATPAQVAQVARAYRQAHPAMPVTPQALTGNWAALVGHPVDTTRTRPDRWVVHLIEQAVGPDGTARDQVDTRTFTDEAEAHAWADRHRGRPDVLVDLFLEPGTHARPPNEGRPAA